MLGIIPALMNVLLQGQRHKVAKARELGLIDQVVPDADAMLAAARSWIGAHPEAQQPWDADGYRMPGGDPSRASFAVNAPAIPANLRKQTKGADYHAPRNILCAAHEGRRCPSRPRLHPIESRYFTDLVCNSPQSKNMTQAFFFDLQAIEKGSSRPAGHERWQATKVGVLGAGMMGAGIAYQCARSGIEVVLKDVVLEPPSRARGTRSSWSPRASSAARSPGEGPGPAGRITPTDRLRRPRRLRPRHRGRVRVDRAQAPVFGETEPVVAPDALLCSNTSTLPITELAEGVQRAEDFIGLHFFSPVDKMPLVEIIRGERTSDATVAKAVDVVQQIKKTPIVVNDAAGSSPRA
jgi:3-hydroxyacyl-CoA dehydrogenase / enoyl-CoA hydratase / 3-hydroxybutyryl-CoA epimerase